MEKVSQEEVLSVLKQKGPCLPRDIVKSLGKSDTFMVGAVLSGLTRSNQAKTSNTKVGTSPTYYLPGQEQNLVILSKYLKDKDKLTYDLLFQKKVLRDSKLDTLTRVSLRNIKDFAKPIEINVNNNKEIFWRWYGLSNNEAISLIKGMFGKKEVPKPEPVIEEKIDPQEQFVEPVKPFIEKKLEPIKETSSLKTENVVKEFQFKPNVEQKIETQSSLNPEIESSEFLIQLRNYFKNNNIQIDKEIQIKKNSEYDFLIKMPSAFGKINFFCKAKSKKKNNEGDVAAAYLSADEYRLPTIFLTTGEFTKKAEKELTKYKQITVKRI